MADIEVSKIIKKVKEGYLKDILSETKWMYQFIGTYTKQVVIYTLVGLLSVSISIYMSVLLKDIIEEIIHKRLHGIINTGIFYVLMTFANFFVWIVVNRLTCVINARISKEIKTTVFSKIMVSDWESLQKHHSGDLMTRIAEDTGNVGSSVLGWIPNLIIDVFSLAASGAIILYYDSSLALVFLLAIPVLLISSRTFVGKMYEANTKMREVSSEMNSFNKEAFHNIQSVKAFGLIHLFCKNMVNLQEKNVEATLKHNKYSILSWASMTLCGEVTAMMCIAWIIYHVFTGKLSLGILYMFVVLGGYVADSFKSMINMIPTVVATVASTKRLRTIMEIPAEEIEDDRSDKIHAEGNRVGLCIEINSLDFSYQNGKQVFENASIEAYPGEIIALVGPSGEGKTTMLRILMGLIRSQKGEAIVYPKGSRDEFMPLGPNTRRLAAYVPQENTMLSGTVADNMRLLAPDATDEEIIEALKKACAYDFISALPDGIDAEIGESGGGFSEGQNQNLHCKSSVKQCPHISIG